MSELVHAGGASSTGAVDVKLGIIAHEEVMWVPTLLQAWTAPAPVLEVPLPLVRRAYKGRPSGNGYDVALAYEGHLTPESANEEDFSLDGSLGQEPIEKQPDILDLQKQFGGTIKDGKIQFPVEYTPRGASKAVRNPMAGVEEYYAPSLVWTRRWVSFSLALGSLVRSLGKIDIPPGNPPELSGGRNWIKIKLRAAYRGNVWAIDESWLLSDEGGWLEEIYRYR